MSTEDTPADTPQVSSATKTSSNPHGLGGRREGAGRPKGARSQRPSRVEIDAQGSIKKLEALGFDPIEAHIKAIEEIDIRLDKEDKKRKPSSMAISQLLSIKEKHVSSLMRYGYRQVPEKTEVETTVPSFGVSLNLPVPQDTLKDPSVIEPDKLEIPSNV